MLRTLAGVALFIAAPLAAAPIAIDGSGYATGSDWGHLYINGEGVYISAALVASVPYGSGRCLAGEVCNFPFEGSGGADNVFDLTDVIGTYKGQTITLDTFVQVLVWFHGIAQVHGFPYPSQNQYTSVTSTTYWNGVVRIWPNGPQSASIELGFEGTGLSQIYYDAYPNQNVCPPPPGGWTHQPPDGCFATYFEVRALDGTFTGTLDEVPEPATWMTAGIAGLLAAALRRRYTL